MPEELNIKSVEWCSRYRRSLARIYIGKKNCLTYKWWEPKATSVDFFNYKRIDLWSLKKFDVLNDRASSKAEGLDDINI